MLKLIKMVQTTRGGYEDMKGVGPVEERRGSDGETGEVSSTLPKYVWDWGGGRGVAAGTKSGGLGLEGTKKNQWTIEV